MVNLVIFAFQNIGHEFNSMPSLGNKSTLAMKVFNLHIMSQQVKIGVSYYYNYEVSIVFLMEYFEIIFIFPINTNIPHVLNKKFTCTSMSIL